MAEEYKPLLNENQSHRISHSACHGEVKLYRRRWYILALFGLQCIVQVMVWSTWGPLASSVELAFGWDHSNIALLSSWSQVMFVVTGCLGAWILDKKGLRWSGCICASVVAIGAVIRCITTSLPHVTWVMNLGQAINGLGCPLVYGTPPLLSARWFPAGQRACATGISTGLTMLGMAASFLIGPLIVPDVSRKNVTDEIANQSSSTEADNIREGVARLMYIEAAFAVFVLILTLVYYPAGPPTPPSVSAHVERFHFMEGLVKLVRSRNFWQLAIVCAFSNGVYASWLSVADINLSNLGVSQASAGSIGFFTVMVSATCAILLGIFGDFFYQKMKLCLIVLYSAGSVLFLIYCLVSIDVIPFHIAWFYVTSILGGVALNGGLPLFYELTCEAAYPVSEGTANSLLTLLNALSSVIFYLILLAPLDPMWMNWANFGCVTLCVPALVTYSQGDHPRRQVDSSARPP